MRKREHAVGSAWSETLAWMYSPSTKRRGPRGPHREGDGKVMIWLDSDPQIGLLGKLKIAKCARPEIPAPDFSFELRDSI
jgi:hypothetical protein